MRILLYEIKVIRGITVRSYDSLNVLLQEIKHAYILCKSTCYSLDMHLILTGMLKPDTWMYID